MEPLSMDTPLELTFHNIEPSDALKTAVREHLARLEQYHDHIIGCRVVIELPHKTQKASGNQPDVHIVLRVPGKEIVVSRGMNHNGHKKADNDAYAVLDEAFITAQQQLKDWRRVSHGNVKYKSGEPRGTAGESGLET
jgi:ribosomal subunit interface protein